MKPAVSSIWMPGRTRSLIMTQLLHFFRIFNRIKKEKRWVCPCGCLGRLGPTNYDGARESLCFIPFPRERVGGRGVGCGPRRRRQEWTRKTPWPTVRWRSSGRLHDCYSRLMTWRLQFTYVEVQLTLVDPCHSVVNVMSLSRRAKQNRTSRVSCTSDVVLDGSPNVRIWVVVSPWPADYSKMTLILRAWDH